jgi:hypothetical protein
MFQILFSKKKLPWEGILNFERIAPGKKARKWKGCIQKKKVFFGVIKQKKALLNLKRAFLVELARFELASR